MYVWFFTYPCLSMCPCSHVFIHVCVPCPHVFAHVGVSPCPCVCLSMYVFPCVHVFTYVCVPVYPCGSLLCRGLTSFLTLASAPLSSSSWTSSSWLFNTATWDDAGLKPHQHRTGRGVGTRRGGRDTLPFFVLRGAEGGPGRTSGNLFLLSLWVSKIWTMRKIWCYWARSRD